MILEKEAWSFNVPAGISSVGATFHGQVAFFNLICEEETTNVNGSGVLGGRAFAILQQKNGGFVVSSVT